MTAALFANPVARDDIRAYILRTRPELKHDFSTVRREAIRLALYRSNEDPLLADDAFEVFFAERNRVTLFNDALPALTFLSARFPVVALSNGNADVHRVGIGHHFAASISAQAFGHAKPDARIFHAAAGAVSVAVENVLHIGDDPAMDVLGALNAGMQAAWLTRSSEPWLHEPHPHMTVSDLTQLCEHFGMSQGAAA